MITRVKKEKDKVKDTNDAQETIEKQVRRR